MAYDYRTNWQLPALPLGPAIKRHIPQPVDLHSQALHVFEWQTHEQVEKPTAPRAASPFKVGDRVIPTEASMWRESWGVGTVVKVGELVTVDCDWIYRGCSAVGAFFAQDLEHFAGSQA